MLGMVLYIIFLFSIAILAGWWLLLFTKLIAYRHPAPAGLLPVTVIIAARNEAHNLRANLPSVLRQKYPKYEVLVVDDHSADDTQAILDTLSANYPHLRGINNTTGEPGKKGAITEGIAQAKHDWILVTDADCIPETSDWIRTMVARRGQHEVVLGYGPMIREKNPVNLFSRFETVMTAIQYFSWALAGRPYMGVGRNMLYQKKLFYETGGFEAHHDLKSGDDDLFVQALSGEHPAGICLHPDTFMYSRAKDNFHEFLQQKARHASTSVRYQMVHKVGLTIFSAAQMLFYPAVILMLSLQFSPVIILLSAFTILLKWILFSRIAKRLDAGNIVKWFPVLDLLYSLYLWVLFMKILLPGKIEWKS